MKNNYLNILVNVSRIVFGLTFVFSGFVKAVDPMGSAYKFLDYFRAFDLMFLSNFAIPAAVVLAALEFAIGAAILMGIARKASTILGLLFMLFFTPLTLYLAVANPVKDCGCFGDAIVLSNWETFYKNVVLLLLSFLLFVYHKNIIPLFSRRFKYIPLVFSVFYSVAISVIALTDMPIIDFRPFKQGINIPEEMKADSEGEEYVLVYEKEGKKQEFTLEDYPQDDPSWEFVETKTIVSEHSKQPTIVDFFVTDADGEDMTESILSDPNPTFLLISPDWAISDDSHLDKINNLYDYAHEMGYSFIALSSADPEKEYEWIESTGAEYPFLYSDATILETIIRPVPGVVMLIDGNIIWKAHPKNIPTEEIIEQQIDNFYAGKIEKNDNDRVILYSFLLFFIPILLLLCFDKLMSVSLRKKREI